MHSLSKFLGWLSLGLGAAALIAPVATARLIGVPRSKQTMKALRAVGTRELGVGAGLLSLRWPRAFAILRVAGDAVDLALLTAVAQSRRSRRERVAGSMALVSGILALDTVAATRARR